MTAAEVVAGSARTGKTASQITKRSVGLVLVAIGLAALLRAAPEPGFSAPAAREAAASTPARSEQEALDAYRKLPLVFVPNAGQTDARVRYSAHAPGASFYFTRTALRRSQERAREGGRR
jgi:hypothetical protein